MATKGHRAWGKIRKLPSGKYQASYIGPDQARHTAPTTFSVRIAAEGWLATERRLTESGAWTSPAARAKARQAAGLTLADYAKRWLEHRNISRRTRDSYRYLLDLHILPVLGDAVLSEITTEDVRAWHAGLDSTYETRNARAYGVLTAVLNTAVDDDLIERSPARIRGAATVKHTKSSVVLLEADELGALAAEMPQPLRLTVLLAGWCGLRRGELFALTRADIAANCATVRINKAVTYRESRYVCGPPKTKESNRTVTVPTHLRPVIAAHLREHVGVAKTALLFPDPETGSFYTEGRFRGPFDTAREAIGHPDLHFHHLRHFGGVMAALAGATTREVMDRLGHTTSTAAMRYQHVAAGRADALSAALSALAAEP
jgi:integrase